MAHASCCRAWLHATINRVQSKVTGLAQAYLLPDNDFSKLFTNTRWYTLIKNEAVMLHGGVE